MIGINDIKKSALALGACNKVESIKSVSDAVDLLMTPQGREFAIKSGYPTLPVWEANEMEAVATGKVLINAGLVVSSDPDIVVVGSSTVKYLADSPDYLHHVIAMHGAKVIVDARNYAVVSVTAIDATVEVSNDSTAKVTVEQSEKGGKS